ncbi:uncharacterized protein LOC122380415 [Amphibalanus amphitrite]|uniref:uncharacterized protein LOC122366528 n=1 Tax=Amphibalanus amphitrite TaxID=1232801 RepID=UPI001C920591|nr:uncharacterized protein LOC122366528 [Amphibalanus amphitrite]XP_043219502.1 uncharacterized protein LOC122380415 [Amphibalanus amphitrite]
MKLQILLIAACVCVASAGIPKKLFKKYAMKKVMESCFGEQVLSDLKAEVAAACEKCHGRQGPALPQLRNRLQAMLAGSELGQPQPSLYSQNVQYVAIPVQFQPVQAQRRWRRDAHHGKFGAAKLMRLRNKISSMVGNVTCVMQEMNMLTADNEVNYDSIKARFSALPVSKGLVADLEESVEECRQFSSCLPESIFEKTPITAGFGKQVAFFRCMKNAKIGACMKKDFREQYLPELMKDDVNVDGEESFQTIITSAILEEDSMM